MELEEEEAQVCRLCGNSESMYIDIFGEEGTKRYLGFKIHSKINILVAPDDGLPQVICMRCVGTLEFLCDFYSTCHNTQKDLESTVKGESGEEEPKDKLESDTESNKENVLPTKNGKHKGKPGVEQSSKTAECDENLIPQETEVSNDLSTEKNNDLLALDNNSTNEQHNGNIQENLTVVPCNNFENQTAKENFDSKPVEVTNLQTSQVPKSDSSNQEILIKCTAKKSLTKNEKNINKQSKSYSSNSTKSKKGDGKSGKTIDKYFTLHSKSRTKSKNEENKNPNYNAVVNNENTVISHTSTNENTVISNLNASENIEENIIFEGTVINSTGDTSIIMPLKMESYDTEIRLDQACMADGSEIVQAQEIVWITNNRQLPEAEKPKTTIITNLSKNASPAPGDEAESMEINETIVEQTSTQDMQLPSAEKLIVLEVQLPAKENVIELPKNFATLNRNRSISSTSSERRFSEGKFARISELMTEEQKREIETGYTIDMSRVDELKVTDNMIVLDKSKFQCKICDANYPRLDKCQVHIWRHLDMKPYLCKKCDFSTLTVSNIRCHIRKSHLKIKPFECHICNKKYNSATLLDEHLNIHTGSRPYQCTYCDFASTSKQVLSHHVLIHKAEKDVICDVCGKAFYSKGRMRAHKITHNKEQAFKCTLCSTYVLHEEALERHYKNVHTKDYVCKTCNKVYKSRKALHNHESVHSDAKFECPMCPNVYKSTHILKEHIMKHQGIRQYKCNNCSKSFAQQSHLAAHMAVHSNITYNCPGCQKGFNRHDNMKVHAKRCELFLADPDLQNLLTKRKISFSKNNTAKVSKRKGKLEDDENENENKDENKDEIKNENENENKNKDDTEDKSENKVAHKNESEKKNENINLKKTKKKPKKTQNRFKKTVINTDTTDEIEMSITENLESNSNETVVENVLSVTDF